ncbi:MAG: PEP/pyruvate-binding domain-containing protein [Capsulimonadaceae bacterium]|nr:PEP/pyruvate-binding domain-containing protein [Capsulimonadaceae bacterium]
MGHEKNVWFFDEGMIPPSSSTFHKAVNLAALAGRRISVPPGFTLEFDSESRNSRSGLPDSLLDTASAALASLEHRMGRRFADPANPLLLAVRAADDTAASGASRGILNLGLNDEIAESLVALTGKPRFVYDCYRRFLTGFAHAVLGVAIHFEPCVSRLTSVTGELGGADELRRQCDLIRTHVRIKSGREIPRTPADQLEMALDSVGKLSRSSRPAAAIVQIMVFGNMGRDCGSGIAWTRNPATGLREIGGVYLREAQGEDLNGHQRPALRLSQIEDEDERVGRQLRSIRAIFERFAGSDIQFDFTVESGKVYVLGWRIAPAVVPRFVLASAKGGRCTADNIRVA